MTCPINCLFCVGYHDRCWECRRNKAHGLSTKNLQLAKDIDLSFQSDFPRSGKGFVQSSHSLIRVAG